MQAIRNEGQAPANGAAPDSAASSDEGRFANPGAGSEGAGESAESGAAPTSPAPATQSSTLFPHEEGPSFLSVALRFFGLLAVMGFVFYLVMRYIRNKSGLPAVGGGELVHVVASIPLVQGKFLQIVDVAGKLMALGVSEAGVQMLTEINDGIAADRIRLWQSSKRPEQAASSALERLVGALKGSDFRFWQTADRKRDFPDFQQLLRAQGAAPLAAVSSAPDAPSGADAADQSDDLKELLRQQKARLTALQRPRKN